MNFINGSRNKGWCPICEEHNQRLSDMAAFWNHDGKFICHYRMCKACVVKIQSSEGLTSEIGKMIESNLLSKFPDLWKLLPADYGSCEAAQWTDLERTLIRDFCKATGIKTNF